MPVTNVPGWIGSSSVSETGERWMSAARAGLLLPASPGWMSEMAGKFTEIRVTITASNHNFATGDLHNLMLAAAGGSWPANAQWRIIVNTGVQLVCRNAGEQCMWFGGSINGKVIIENHGTILGRGGQGGAEWANGNPGGHAIYRESKITLEIINNGIIAGGGGGGGTAHRNISSGRRYGGGGGAPFGAGGYAAYSTGPAASYDSPGVPYEYAGRGGYWGQNGVSDTYAGGVSGNAIAGSGTIIWTNRGDIRGPVS